jgi:hypothetical protein
MDRIDRKFRRYAGALGVFVAAVLTWRYVVLERPEKPPAEVPANVATPPLPDPASVLPMPPAAIDPVAVPKSIQELCGCGSPLSVAPADAVSEQPTNHSSGETLLTAVPGTAEAVHPSAAAVRFEREIQPIFVDHCYRCHGPQKQESGLRFDQREGNYSASASGLIPLVPGNPLASSVISRMTSDDSHVRMPQNSDPLSEAQIAVVQQWIADGAEWPDGIRHWAYRKPVSPLRPSLQDPSWCRNEIDDFILAKLEAEGLRPAAEADRVTLARRLSLDLIGLPPTPAEVDAFVADKDPDAYDHFVDRLLASPHYGEKWAVRWLDLARYADTNGFEGDLVRTMWLYRDWVIDAINTDMPFDQFTLEQLAGDLLPSATSEQQVATGFMRNSAVAPDINQHRFEMLVDRVNTLGTTWLGLTLGCAQCHDHKFDPVSQREFYQLYAIFNRGVDECEGVFYKGKQITAASPLNNLTGQTLVMADRKQPLTTHLKVRGAFDVDGEVVEMGVLKSIFPPRDQIKNRISLACWLVDENNPLTARVTMNRIWEAVFGIGIVRTSEDFGLRGERPSHPELLDWLAVEFRRRGWSMKAMVRLIVTSATYRQTSRVPEDSWVQDPENRLLARGARFRVDAELVRDIALTASGLLSRNIGGPSVFPEQPEGTTEKQEFGVFQWKTDTGENRYRRGLYTHWKRAAPYPSFVIFDAPGRMLSCSRRVRSSNPLQALTVLNDPVYFEAAVHLGRRMLAEGGGTVRTRILCGARLCISRVPAESELDLLEQLYQDEQTRFENDSVSAALQLGGESVFARYPELSVTDWATCSTVANVLLNLDETITKE